MDQLLDRLRGAPAPVVVKDAVIVFAILQRLAAIPREHCVHKCDDIVVAEPIPVKRHVEGEEGSSWSRRAVGGRKQLVGACLYAVRDSSVVCACIHLNMCFVCMAPPHGALSRRDRVLYRQFKLSNVHVSCSICHAFLYLKPIAAARPVPFSTSSARRACEKSTNQRVIMISASSPTPASFLSKVSKYFQPLAEMRAWGEEEWEGGRCQEGGGRGHEEEGGK